MAVLAVSGLAFSQASKTHATVNQQWFLEEGLDPNEASSYRTTNPNGPCTGTASICSITAPNVSGQPNLIHGDVIGNEDLYQATFRD